MLWFGYKKLFFGILIGVVVGLWLGINIGKDQALYEYPFSKRTMAEKAKDKADDIISDTKKALHNKLDENLQ